MVLSAFFMQVNCREILLCVGPKTSFPSSVGLGQAFVGQSAPASGTITTPLKSPVLNVTVQQLSFAFSMAGCPADAGHQLECFL
jgi:hypothetical protein